MKIDDAINQLAMIRGHMGNVDIFIWFCGDDYQIEGYMEPEIGYNKYDKKVVIT